MPGSTLQRRLSLAIAFAALASFAFFVGYWALWFYSWRDTTPRGPLVEPATWPQPIRELHAAMERANVDTVGFDVYLVYGQPGKPLSRVICRMADTSQTFEFLAQHLELKPVPDSGFKYSDLGRSENAPPDWWTSSSNNAQVFVSRNIWDEIQADRYVVARDEARKRIYIHYFFDF